MYVNPGSVLAVSVILSVLGSAAVVSRFVTRVRQKQHLGPDDWLCLPALAFLLTSGALIIYGTARKTFGYHTPASADVSATLALATSQLLLLTKLEWIINLLNPIGTGFIRLSFMFFYRRIFRGQTFNILSWALIGFMITWMCASFIAYLNICNPVSAGWGTVAEINQHCSNPRWILGAFGIIGLATDVVILIFPFFWIWRLRMDASKKWAVSSVFLCGLFTVATSALRATAGLKSALVTYGVEQDYLGLKSNSDIIGRVSILIFWQFIENGTGLVVCCLPSLKPILARTSLNVVPTHVRSLVSSWRHGRSSKSSSVSTDTSHSTLASKDQTSRITVTQTVDLSSIPVEVQMVRMERWQA